MPMSPELQLRRSCDGIPGHTGEGRSWSFADKRVPQLELGTS
jgi:hypothetical protein